MNVPAMSGERNVSIMLAKEVFMTRPAIIILMLHPINAMTAWVQAIASMLPIRELAHHKAGINIAARTVDMEVISEISPRALYACVALYARDKNNAYDAIALITGIASLHLAVKTVSTKGFDTSIKPKPSGIVIKAT